MADGKPADDSQAAVLYRQARDHLSRNETRFALKKLKACVTEAPDWLEPRFQLAQVFARRGDTAEAIAALRECVHRQPENAEYHASLGMLLLGDGQPEPAWRAFELAVAHDAGVPLYRLYAGAAAFTAGDAAAALQSFQALVAAEPATLSRSYYDDSPPQIRAMLDLAYRLIGRRQAEITDAILAEIATAHPNADLSRLSGCFDILVGSAQFEGPPLQRPERLKFPNLAAKPWFERQEFSFLRAIEEMTHAIRTEYQDALGKDASLARPYFEAAAEGRVDDSLGRLVGSEGWQSLHLFKFGPVAENVERFPKTVGILEAAPLARAGTYFPEVVFSVLNAGASIPPHCGLSNARLAVHLPLLVPPSGCSITVGGETRSWREGECLIFDDSFEHEAHNRSELPRAVLIFEIWHPDLTPAEIEGLQRLLERRDLEMGGR